MAGEIAVSIFILLNESRERPFEMDGLFHAGQQQREKGVML